MRINKCRISIQTTMPYATQLQQEASRQLHGVLKDQLAQRLGLWLQSRQQPVRLDQLRLDIGTLPRADFNAQFAPKVMAALDEILHSLRLPVVQGTALGTVDYALSHSLPNQLLLTEQPVQKSSNLAAQFLRYLQTGYWPPQVLHNEHLPASSVISASPTAWLAHYLRQPEPLDAPWWQELSALLTMPQIRRRLLSCLTSQNWLLWQQRVLALSELPEGKTDKPDAIDMLLLIWRHQALNSESAAPIIRRFYAQELQLLSVEQLHQIEMLLTQGGIHNRLPAQHAWLFQLLTHYGNVLWQRLSPAVRRQLRDILPDLATLLNKTSLRPPTFPAGEADVDQRPTLPAAGEALPVHHAGLVLLWPILPRWLSSLGLLTKTDPHGPLTFASTQAQIEAIALLDALIWKDDEGGEWRSLFSKLLCGWPLSAPIESWPDQQRISTLCEPVEVQLQAVLQQLQQLQLIQAQSRPGLDKFTPRTFCQMFLQRNGTLQEEGFGWQLTVEPHPADLLLWAIPWPLEQIFYPWLTGPITINWQLPVLPYAV